MWRCKARGGGCGLRSAAQGCVFGMGFCGFGGLRVRDFLEAFKSEFTFRRGARVSEDCSLGQRLSTLDAAGASGADFQEGQAFGGEVLLFEVECCRLEVCLEVRQSAEQEVQRSQSSSFE